MDKLTTCNAYAYTYNSDTCSWPCSAPYTNANSIQVNYPRFYDYSSLNSTPSKYTTYGLVLFEFSAKGMTAATSLTLSSHVVLYTPLATGTGHTGNIKLYITANVSKLTRTTISSGSTSSVSSKGSTYTNNSAANATLDPSITISMSDTKYKWAVTDDSVFAIRYWIYPWGSNGSDQSWSSDNNYIRISNVIIKRS